MSDQTARLQTVSMGLQKYISVNEADRKLGLKILRSALMKGAEDAQLVYDLAEQKSIDISEIIESLEAEN